jgi:two-component system sensor histidine kinase/response regulator
MIFTTPDILIVEDDVSNRELMAARLQYQNYQLRFAQDGQQALDMVAAKRPDLILLDTMLPKLKGPEVLQILRQSYSMVDLPVIMVTAIDDDHHIVQALEMGANDYITKPISFGVLQARIQTHLSLKQLAAMNVEFLTTASHDLRKPLAVIQDIANQARLKLAGSAQVDKQTLLSDLTLISQSASYMNNIANCILDMQASGFGQIRLTKTPLSMHALVEEAIERHRDRANEKRIQIIHMHSADRLVVEADRTRISQVLDNLLGNAIKFCSAGDTVRITLKSSLDQVRVDISDTGPGLRPEDFPQLFMKHAQLSNKASDNEHGTGLGLSICKQLVELHNGEIGARNNTGRGATFWFSLPLFKLRPVEA